ncbi:MAG: 50S ribosomal protein L35 [Planctomycetales bacterium 4484_123]|nr:MAG: 50S ribosomal protein L35 [Planctomycetales bacterium 4484_123]
MAKTKMKTNKAIAKRIKVTAGGKLRRRRPLAGHLKSRKSPKRVRNLRRTRSVSKGFGKQAKRMLGL